MQSKVNARKSCEGKMLSSWVNKYMSERGTFDTEVCSYTFGMEDPEVQGAVDITSPKIFESSTIDKTQHGRKSLADHATVAVSKDISKAYGATCTDLQELGMSSNATINVHRTHHHG